MVVTMGTMATNHYTSSSAQFDSVKSNGLYHSHHAASNNKSISKAAKRRSAVERLEASKANYVKSEKVLDAKQELRHSNHLKVRDATPSIETLKNTWKQFVHPCATSYPACHQNENVVKGCHTLNSGRFSRHSLPPKSPSVNRACGKYDCRGSSCKPKEDFQFKLRKLISLRDNSSESDYSNQSHECPVIQARVQQEVDYNLHKSMPELNKMTRNNENSEFVRSVTNSSLFNNCQTALNCSHRATSDYVSRSPSCKQEHLKYNDCDSGSSSCVDEDDIPAQLTNLSKRRPILRSKSDISYKYSKEPYIETVKKVQKCSPELERFFDSMGLDVTELSSLTQSQTFNSSCFFRSISSIDSDDRRDSIIDEDDSLSDAHTSGRNGLKNIDLVGKNGSSETSIIERNARIIKWLYNCRKSHEFQK